MKVGAKIHLFNFLMRQRRLEMGLTQKALAEMAGVRLVDISAMERLELLIANKRMQSASVISDNLTRVARALEMDFDRLFPPDYIQMLEDKLLPKRRRGLIVCKEVALDALPPSLDALMLPDPAEEFTDSDSLKVQMAEVLAELPEREQQVIRLRFGLDGNEPMTLAAIGCKFGITAEAIRYCEHRALRKLRHPYRTGRLRAYLGGDDKPITRPEANKHSVAWVEMRDALRAEQQALDHPMESVADD